MQNGLFDPAQLIPPGRVVSEEALLKLKKLENDLLIAQLGLKGTLWGAAGCLAVIVLIVLSPTFTPRNLVEGWQVVTIVASMVISIVAYGAFIFNRALQLAAKADRKGIDMSAILRLPPPPEPPPASEPTPP